MDWNFDMTTAPKGIYKIVNSGKNGTRKVHIADRIMTLGWDMVVRPSCWLPETKNWRMYTSKFPPIAWQEYPDPPRAVPAEVRSIIETYKAEIRGTMPAYLEEEK